MAQQKLKRHGYSSGSFVVAPLGLRMWKPHLRVIAKKSGQAIHVLDRFHIAAKMNKAIDEVRAQKAKAMNANGMAPLLKNSRWCLLKNPENRTRQQKLKFSEIVLQP